MSPSTATRRPCGRLGEVVEGGPHRHGVGVVAVVDDDHPSAQRDPLAAQARERDPDGAGRLDADRRARRRARRARSGACARSRTAPSRPSGQLVDVAAGPEGRRCVMSARRWGSSSGSPAGTTAVPCAGRSRISSAFVAAIASIEPSSSRWTGPTFTIDADVRLGDRDELGDLPGAAHRHLQHEHLGAGGRAEDRERQRRSRC